MRAINDVLGKKKTLMDDVTANALLNIYMTKLQADKVKPAIEEGQKFLAKNKLKTSVNNNCLRIAIRNFNRRTRHQTNYS